MSSQRLKQRQGSILIVTLTTIVAIAAMVGIAMSMTTQTARITQRSQNIAILQAGAEGALEQGYAIWKARMAQQNRALGVSWFSGANAVPQPTFTDLVYSPVTPAAGPLIPGDLTIQPADTYGTPSANPAPVTIDVPGYPGWRGRSYLYLASVHLKSTTQPGKPLEYGVKRYFSYTEVPLFQTMYFFEHDIEFYRPNTMIVGGLVHTNRWGFASNDLDNNTPLTFQNNVSYVLGWTNSTIPYRADTWSGFSNSAHANDPPTFVNGPSQLNQVNRLEPLGQDPANVLDLPPGSPLSPSGQLIGPDGDSDLNPNNDSFHELIETPTGPLPDPPEIHSRRLSTKAGIIVSINGSVKTVTTQNGTTLTAAQALAIQNALSSNNVYDQREQGTVRMSNLDMSAIRTTLDGATGFNGVFYISDETPLSGGVSKNAIRLQKGGLLPANGLTIASPNGIYIQGDYNTGTTNAPTAVPANVGNGSNTASPTVPGYTRKPSAVIADAVMILSNSWNDANANSAIGSRVASNTTVNTAMLAGFVPSGYVPPTGSQYGYSGGANNYPRFLESWTGKYLTYFGSMVELFQSTSFTGRWNTGPIYAPPLRCWNYDTNFTDNPPPGSIDAIATSRGTWARF